MAASGAPRTRSPTRPWTGVNTGLPTNNLGTIVEDPNDASGNTLYAGTGEANAINEAGLGLYKTTDGGDHWALVAGIVRGRTRPLDRRRADRPDDPSIIWLGTSLGRNGQSSTNGGAAEPPGAPELGVYRSTDGGQTFSLQFAQPQDFYLGGVTDIELDPNDHTSVWASLFGDGTWRSPAGGAWEQVFVPQNPDGDDRVDIALADLGATTRAYAMDGGTDGDGNTDRRRLARRRRRRRRRDAGRRRRRQLGLDRAVVRDRRRSGLRRLPALPVPVRLRHVHRGRPEHPDTVWEGGSMVYEEIRPLQDASLRGLASNRSNGRAVMRSTDGGVHWTDMTADTARPRTTSRCTPTSTRWSSTRPTRHRDRRLGRGRRAHRRDLRRHAGQCSSREGVSDDPTHGPRRLPGVADGVPHRIVNLNAGLATLQFVSLAVDPRNPNGDLLGGTQDNGTFAYSGSPRTWFESVNGDGASSGFDAVDPKVRVHTFFLGAFDVNHHGADPHWWTFIAQPILDSGEAVSFYTPMITDPVVGGTIYAGAQHVWRTLDDGGPQASLEAHCLGPGGVPTYDPTVTTCGDFEAIGADLTDPSFGDRTDGAAYISYLARATSDTSTLWVGLRRGRVFVTSNADAPAAQVAFNRIDTGQTPNRFVSAIAVDPKDANHAFISYSGYGANTPSTPGHVYEARYDPATRSAKFKDISYDLPDLPITAIAYDDLTGDLYGGTDTGVVRLPAGATSWGQAAAGLPPATTPGLTMASKGRVLYAATYGRSVYKLALAPGAVISGPDTAVEGSAVRFDGRSSAAFGGASLTYHWTFPDGTTATGATPTWTAQGVGPKRLVTLTVTAPDGRSGTTTRTIAVTPRQATPPPPAPSSTFVSLSAASYHLHGRKLKVGLVCPETASTGCVGRIDVRVRVGRQVLRLGGNAFAVSGGRSVRVSVTTTRATLRRLGGTKARKATVNVVQLLSGQPPVHYALKFRLRP